MGISMVHTGAGHRSRVESDLETGVEVYYAADHFGLQAVRDSRTDILNYGPNDGLVFLRRFRVKAEPGYFESVRRVSMHTSEVRVR